MLNHRAIESLLYWRSWCAMLTLMLAAGCDRGGGERESIVWVRTHPSAAEKQIPSAVEESALPLLRIVGEIRPLTDAPPSDAPSEIENQATAALDVQAPSSEGFAVAEHTVSHRVEIKRPPGAASSVSSQSTLRSPLVDGLGGVGHASTERAAASYRDGIALATKGAHFAARARLLEALESLVQAADAAERSSRHSQAMHAAMRALEEAADFMPRGNRGGETLDLALIVRSHRTTLLASANLEGLTPTEAAECYHQFARQKLVAAVSGLPGGSHVLHALGRLHAALFEQRSTAIAGAADKARVYYAAALALDVSNFGAANDLGVLEAQLGRLGVARQWLARSASLAPQSSAARNLAFVEQRLGVPTAAPAAAAVDHPALQAWQSVRWVEPSAFARTAEVSADLRPISPAAAAPTSTPPTPRTASRTVEASRWLQ